MADRQVCAGADQPQAAGGAVVGPYRGLVQISVPNLLIAATAEVHGLVVPHHDEDFELIAQYFGGHVIRA
ncbi:MAG: hypothetical protein ACTIIH_00540 [Brevibacterium sp.]|uniref:hypothetical protein n=1 Tax=Brevibacterium sp. TaxID=1701 RepID=UPI003F901473